MPNSLNARKRHRQSLTRRDNNRIAKSRVRTSIRAFEAAIKEGNRETAEQQFRLFSKLIDTATGKKVYHPNTSARKKSRLAKRLNVLA
ncbi:30S ribosomal protein S20 [Candidatus Haliotispira prima]|uniref:Small ribosomal subunit protein bS20 n=1 Tax=Candidatus Haliotispira prima TaxID=3034016 RepID=A0ABY8MEQ2_9SPIO|nr:30S ribosomal protein S20 [Candidatus Haliotispira prima]